MLRLMEQRQCYPSFEPLGSTMRPWRHKMSMIIIVAVLLVFTSLFVVLSLFPYAGANERQGAGIEVDVPARQR